MKSFSSSSVMIHDFLNIIFKQLDSCIRPLFTLFKEKISLLNIVSMGLSLVLVLGYAFTNSYILSNFIAFFLVLLMLRTIALPNLKVSALLLGLAFFYDIFWVFISPKLPFFQGNSVMVTVATNIHLPMMFQCPYTR